MKKIHTDIEIRASAKRIWDFLTDFAAFPQWNPFMIRASGGIAVDSRIDITIQSSPKKTMSFRPRLLVVDQQRELRWRGSLLMPGIFDGEHVFNLQAIDADHIRFTQSEQFTGILVPLVWSSMEANTLKGFTSMNQALKLRAETG